MSVIEAVAKHFVLFKERHEFGLRTTIGVGERDPDTFTSFFALNGRLFDEVVGITHLEPIKSSQ